MSGYLKPDEPTVDVTCDGCGDTFTIYRRAVEEGQEKLCFACLRCGKGGRVPTRHLGSAARLDGAAAPDVEQQIAAAVADLLVACETGWHEKGLNGPSFLRYVAYMMEEDSRTEIADWLRNKADLEDAAIAKAIRAREKADD